MKDTGNRAGLLKGMQSRCGGKQTGEKQREHKGNRAKDSRKHRKHIICVLNNMQMKR